MTEQMGLHHLMGIQCDYSIPLVQQLFATLVIKGYDVHTLKWMTGVQCEATFVDFSRVLGTLSMVPLLLVTAFTLLVGRTKTS